MAVALTPPLDATLVTRLRQGDPDALGPIYDRYGAVAYRVALRTLRDEKLAEDAVQEAFLDLWRRPEVYDPARAPLGSWICVLAHRRAADIARREARRHAAAAVVRWDAPDSYTTEELVLLLTDRRRVDRALRALAPHDRRIIELAYHGGLSQAEIASRLDLPLGTVKSRTFKALRRLRSLFEADPSDSARKGAGLQPLTSSVRDKATIAKQRQQIALLSRLSDATVLPRMASPSDVAATLLTQGLSVLGADAGFIGRRLGTDALQIVHVAGFAYETRERLLIPLDAPYPLAEAVRSDRPLFIASNEELHCDHPGLTRMNHADHACATIPLSADGRLLGALNVTYDSPRTFDAADKELLHLFAEQCARTIAAAEHNAVKTAAEALVDQSRVVHVS